MAIILFWLAPRGTAAESPVWEHLVARASARSRFPGETLTGPGYALFVARSRAAEPAPLLRLDGDAGSTDYLLLDRAVGPADSTDRRSDPWSADRLMDGTPTAAIRWNPASRMLTLHRDIMGQRKLVYARVRGGLVAASGEDILRAHPDIPGDLDDLFMAAYFAALPPGPSETAFRAIRAVGAGETIEIRADGSHRSNVRRLSPDHSWKGMQDQAIVDRFGELLAQSVRTSCLGARRVGISLSAGLDSSSIAAIAARLPRPAGGPVVAVTHRLADFPEIDETAMTAELARSLDMEHRLVAVDDLHPFCDPTLRPVCPDSPHQWPYREWYEAGYREFEASGVDVWLSGAFGDHLFTGAPEWVIDAMRLGRFGILWRQALGEINRRGLLGVMRNIAFRRPISRALGRVARHSERLGWLREPYLRSLQERLDEEIRLYRGFPRPSHCAQLLAAHAGFDSSYEQWYAQRHGMEQRLPFRDPDLIRWCLSIPADFSYRDGQMKWLMREAMRNLLPERLRLREKGSSLAMVFDRGIARAGPGFAALCATGTHHAQRYIRDQAWLRLDPSVDVAVRWLAASEASWLGPA